jgi:hypothetical protein
MNLAEYFEYQKSIEFYYEDFANKFDQLIELWEKLKQAGYIREYNLKHQSLDNIHDNHRILLDYDYRIHCSGKELTDRLTLEGIRHNNILMMLDWSRELWCKVIFERDHEGGLIF